MINIYQRFGDELIGGPATSIPVLTQQQQSGSKLMVVRWSEVMESKLKALVLR
jgi:hypothetical protein